LAWGRLASGRWEANPLCSFLTESWVSCRESNRRSDLVRLGAEEAAEMGHGEGDQAAL